jgi:hypothetical protein
MRGREVHDQPGAALHRSEVLDTGGDVGQRRQRVANIPAGGKEKEEGAGENGTPCPFFHYFTANGYADEQNG